jgi:GT2 family glycosyltransferase
VRFDERTSVRIDEAAVRSGAFLQWASAKEIGKLRAKGRRSLIYEFLRHPTKPRLAGNNVGIWRSDFVRINGYDENFRGWGWEDDDLGWRLRAAGVRIRSILRWTNTFHLWHPPDPTMPASESNARNLAYLNREGRTIRCDNGLSRHKQIQVSQAAAA